jgi:hypothetical protein
MGMTAMAHDSVRLSPAHSGLGCDEHAILSDWLARALCIDAVIDLSDRPWNIGQAGPVFGVFREGSDQASWLIVRSGADWGMADCDDFWVPRSPMSLADVLAAIDASL